MDEQRGAANMGEAAHPSQDVEASLIPRISVVAVVHCASHRHARPHLIGRDKILPSAKKRALGEASANRAASSERCLFAALHLWPARASA